MIVIKILHQEKFNNYYRNQKILNRAHLKNNIHLKYEHQKKEQMNQKNNQLLRKIKLLNLKKNQLNIKVFKK